MGQIDLHPTHSSEGSNRNFNSDNHSAMLTSSDDSKKFSNQRKSNFS